MLKSSCHLTSGGRCSLHLFLRRAGFLFFFFFFFKQTAKVIFQKRKTLI